MRACTLPWRSKKRPRSAVGNTPLVPDAGMDIEAPVALEPEGDEIVGLDPVARQRQRHHERAGGQREEHLAAIGMVVGVPQQHLLAPDGRRHFAGLLRLAGEAQHVVVVDRVVAPSQHVAGPFELEDAFRGASLVAGAGIDRTAAQRRPAHDLDRPLIPVVDQFAIALQRLRRRFDQAQRKLRQHRQIGAVGLQVGRQIVGHVVLLDKAASLASGTPRLKQGTVDTAAIPARLWADSKMLL